MRHQQAVERVCVMKRQGFEHGNVRIDDGEFNIACCLEVGAACVPDTGMSLLPSMCLMVISHTEAVLMWMLFMGSRIRLRA